MVLAVGLFVAAGIQICGSLAAVMIIGKPREPMTPGLAVFSVTLTAVAVTVMVLAGMRLL